MTTTTQPHPLTEYADRIDPTTVYTVRQLAELMELTASSVAAMARYGWLPGSRMRPHRRGGRAHTWTGTQLVLIASRPLKLRFDHDKYSPVTLYRVGCRCAKCVAAHSSASRSRRRALSEKTFPRDRRDLVVALIAQGTPVPAAAQEAGVTVGQIYGRATWDEAFAEALDEAAWSLCVLGDDNPLCSTASGYRGHSGNACRGTGCREWRRDQSQQERAVSHLTGTAAGT